MAAHRRAARRVGLRRRRDQRLVRLPQRRRRRCTPASTSRCPARRAARREAARRGRRRRGRAKPTSTGRSSGSWRSPSGSAPAAARPTEETADDDETRDVIRRAAIAGDGAAEERAAARCRWRPTRRRVALIGPNARFGRPQGGGSAEVRPEHGRGPLDALAGPWPRRHVRDRRLDRQVPAAVHAATSTSTFADDDGHSLTTTASRTKWFWDQPPSDEFSGPRVRGPRRAARSTPDATGDWEIGVRRRRSASRCASTARRGRHPRGRARRRVLRHRQPGAPGHDRARGRARRTSSTSTTRSCPDQLVRGLVVRRPDRPSRRPDRAGRRRRPPRPTSPS